jgi:hypothetical protein
MTASYSSIPVRCGLRQPVFGSHPLLSRLPAADQAGYVQLVNYFARSEDRNKRNLGTSTFAKHLAMIHAFVCKGDKFDSLRGLLCGIEFGTNSILTSTTDLKRLMVRSKSSINGCFQRLGCTIVRPALDISTIFGRILPGCPSHFFTTRHWCVRLAGEGTELSLSPMANIELPIGEGASRVPAIKENLRVDAFSLSVENLLNRPVQDAGILGMSVDQLPPLRY